MFESSLFSKHGKDTQVLFLLSAEIALLGDSKLYTEISGPQNWIILVFFLSIVFSFFLTT